MGHLLLNTYHSPLHIDNENNKFAGNVDLHSMTPYHITYRECPLSYHNMVIGLHDIKF